MKKEEVNFECFRKKRVGKEEMIQHPKVQREQVGKAPRLGHRSWQEKTATCCATNWVPSRFLMNGH